MFDGTPADALYDAGNGCFFFLKKETMLHLPNNQNTRISGWFWPKAYSTKNQDGQAGSTPNVFWQHPAHLNTKDLAG